MTNELRGGDTHELSTDINVITAEINAYQRVAGEAIFEIGKRLKYVRDDMNYGEYSPWLESIGMDRSDANKFIRIYAELGSANVGTYPQLGMRALYEVAQIPSEYREQMHKIPTTGEAKKPEDMTVRELREVKKALAEKTKIADEAERRIAEVRAESATARRSEGIIKKRLEELEDAEPEVITKTEYVEVPIRDETLEQRLQTYEERFGAIENYSERPRSSNLAEVTTSVMTFSKAVRDLAKRHAYLIQYQDTIAALDPVTRREYDEAVIALSELSRDFGTINKNPIIIDAKYS